MSVRLKRNPIEVPRDGTEVTDPVTVETHFDGMTFAWGPNQVRNFLDDGVGLGHAVNEQLQNSTANKGNEIQEDTLYATNGDARA